MDACKGMLPLGWPENEMYRFNTLMGMQLWNAIIDAGHDPEKLVAKFQEIGDGTLAVGFYKDETDDFKQPIKGLGFIVPMGFWYTTDDRMPLNWIGAKPPAGYGPPGIGKPIDPSYYEIVKGSGNL
ncbi:MAG: hypothetical protein A2Y67_00710 [Candidatus Buchananbacteria bacterium RBG_13_39_9]|uniref:Uncharacterized protein n=1 Tax=Candidatus Buchananbacteria bacterium RBG_13_39_9 TaxID=1797531 RepID=A0A1G1XP40_9BACT|nr:MAG: hypothetical protein A2Y67_00710 [Candidatus Buchananbacteria bacterium RBG_13_39_9]